jgi:uncharacterized membrane protein YozB (DUF420 family)
MSPLLAFEITDLPAVNASLNGLATILLIAGYAAIKGRTRNETRHRNFMLAAFAVSVAFLACYLTYHIYLYYYLGTGARKFPTDAPPAARYSYYFILLTHVILAACVPFFSGYTIWLGLTDRRARHRRLARWTFPIWLYVSVTGVIIYVMLYQLYPAAAG